MRQGILNLRGRTNYSINIILILLLVVLIVVIGRRTFFSEGVQLESQLYESVYERLLITSNHNLKYILYKAEEEKGITEPKFKWYSGYPVLSYVYAAKLEEVPVLNEMMYVDKEDHDAAETEVIENNSNQVQLYESYSEDFNMSVEEAMSYETGSQIYTYEQLNDLDFLINQLYTVDSKIKVTSKEFDVKYFLTKSMKLNLEKGKPSILIYHTHAHEEFINEESAEVKTVVDIGDELARLLQENYGIEVYHHRKAYDVVDGVLDRSKAYELIQPDLKKILKENPTIELMIDLHRDGVPADVHLETEINGKPTARIMFFNGLCKIMKEGKLVEVDYMKNPYVKDNMALSLQMQLKAKELYPSFTRKIYLRDYRYNLHFLPKSMLIEAGAQNNTFEEAMNAMEPLAHILYEVVGK